MSCGPGDDVRYASKRGTGGINSSDPLLELEYTLLLMELVRVLCDIDFCVWDCWGGGKVEDLIFTNPTEAEDADGLLEYTEPGLKANGRGVASAEVYEGG